MNYSKEELFQIFKTQILGKNSVNIAGFTFNTAYNYQISNKDFKIINPELPTLQIKDEDTFKTLLFDYVNEYLASNRLYTKPEMLDAEFSNVENKTLYALTTLFANATFSDFENTNSYLTKRIGFLKNNLVFENNNWINCGNFEGVKDAHILIKMAENKHTLEAPDRLEIKVVKINDNETEEVYLPSVIFGIYNNTAYVYTAQNLKLSNTPCEKLQKELNRARYKINKNISQDEQDVEPFEIISTTLFCGFLKSININKICVNNYLPMRYFAKQQANINKAKNNEEILNELSNKQQLIQENLTNKFTKTFLRIQEQSNAISLYSDLNSNELIFKNNTKILSLNENCRSEFLINIYNNSSQNKDHTL